MLAILVRRVQCTWRQQFLSRLHIARYEGNSALGRDLKGLRREVKEAAHRPRTSETDIRQELKARQTK